MLADPEGSGLYNKVSPSALLETLTESVRVTVVFSHWSPAVLDHLPDRREELCYRLQIRVGHNVSTLILSPSRIPHHQTWSNEPTLVPFSVRDCGGWLVGCFPPFFFFILTRFSSGC